MTVEKKLGWEKFLWEKFQKQFFFTLNPYPRPSTESVFVEIVLTSKWTGVTVSLKGSRQKWQETGPGDQKVNQFLNTNFYEWHFNRLLKHVQPSIIQLYL